MPSPMTWPCASIRPGIRVRPRPSIRKRGPRRPPVARLEQLPHLAVVADPHRLEADQPSVLAQRVAVDIVDQDVGGGGGGAEQQRGEEEEQAGHCAGDKACWRRRARCSEPGAGVKHSPSRLFCPHRSWSRARRMATPAPSLDLPVTPGRHRGGRRRGSRARWCARPTAAQPAPVRTDRRECLAEAREPPAYRRLQGARRAQQIAAAGAGAARAGRDRGLGGQSQPGARLSCAAGSAFRRRS